jgi:diguanylate cyclase (GGDEF)-like protein
VDSLTERRVEDLLDSIFRVATALVRGDRASLLLREEGSSEFIVAKAVGLAEDIRRAVRVREGEGVAGSVAATKRPLLVRTTEDARVASMAGGRGLPERPRTERRYRTESFVSVPILVEGESRGVLSVADPIDAIAFDQQHLATLEVLATHIATCLQQREQDQALQRLAEMDPLTRLFNRRHFDWRLEAEANRAVRSEHLLALLMIDVDRFKHINDVYGHRVGDEVLQAVANGIRQAVRMYDVPTRYGGDEFAVLLPEADTESATRVGRRIVEKISGTIPRELADAGERISLSIGIATFPRPAEQPDELVEAADTAMYRAKRSGGGIRVWEHAFAEGPRGALRGPRAAVSPAPYLADPAKMATAELQSHIPRSVAAEWNALVVGKEGQVLTVALPQPNSAAVDAISKASGFAVYPVYSNPADLEAIRRRLTEARD